jgi:hypothetical protein
MRYDDGQVDQAFDKTFAAEIMTGQQVGQRDAENGPYQSSDEGGVERQENGVDNTPVKRCIPEDTGIRAEDHPQHRRGDEKENDRTE